MENGQEQIERFSLVIRIQHIVLAASVLLLIFTGIPLKFPHWAISRLYFYVIGGVHVSGLIHRVGATGLILVSMFHVVWLAFSREGRRNFRALLPTLYDVKCVFNNMKWFLGLSKERARFGRFSYIEKFDYWAVYWGCVIMIGSGLVLWFHDVAMRYVPKIWIDVAREAHSDEALLATLAIFIWHFYNVHLNPSAFPMSTTWLTGKVTRREMEEHHPLEYEQMIREAGFRSGEFGDKAGRTDG